MSKFDSYYDEGPTSATFTVEVDGLTLGTFREVSGLAVTVEVLEVPEGGENFFVHKLPGRFTWENVVLRRGMTADNGLIAWLDGSSAGGFEAAGKKVRRRTVAVNLVGASGKRLRTWTLLDAFPVRWQGPDLSVESDDFLVEELEIAHHGLQVTDAPASGGRQSGRGR